MTTDDELFDALEAALEAPDREPPEDRITALRAAAASRAEPTTLRQPQRPRPAWRRRLPLVAASLAAGLAFLVGAVGFSERRADEGVVAGGTVEFEVTMRSPSGGQTAKATGILTGIGRTVKLRTDELPILPKGELYELWFVGPGDTLRTPNRISAGTFHPDEQGRSRVDLTAAVDPAKYPVISVTAEPGDGNPMPTGPEVLRARVAPD